MSAIEMRIYDEQGEFIRRHFGKKARGQANYGWGVTGGVTWIEVSTKVYGHGILTSHGNRQRIKHFWNGVEQ